MKRSLIAGALALAALSQVSQTFAADLPPAPPPIARAPVAYLPPPQIYNWSGCYVGGVAGAAMTKSEVAYAQNGAYFGNPAADQIFANTLGSPTLNGTGFTGGAEAGCNYQASALVVGVEADGSYLHTSQSYVASGTLPVAGAVVTSNVTASTDWLATVRARLGVAADRALFFVTGGAAFGDEKLSQNFFHTATATAEAGTATTNRAGWTAGGGIEYAFTNNVTAKVEYLYVDLGTSSFNTANTGFPTFTATNSMKLTENIVRAGLNFKWGGGY